MIGVPIGAVAERANGEERRTLRSYPYQCKGPMRGMATAACLVGLLAVSCGGQNSTPASPTLNDLSKPTSVSQWLVYQNDDGAQTGALTGCLDCTYYAIEKYEVVRGAEKVLGAQIRLGSTGAATTADILCWTDPDNDGNLTNLVVLQSLRVQVSVGDTRNTETFNYFFASPVTLPAGSSFYLGVRSHHGALLPTPETYVAYESNPPSSNASYVAYRTGVQPVGSLEGFRINGPGLELDFAIRAIASAIAP